VRPLERPVQRGRGLLREPRRDLSALRTGARPSGGRRARAAQTVHAVTLFSSRFLASLTRSAPPAAFARAAVLAPFLLEVVFSPFRRFYLPCASRRGLSVITPGICTFVCLLSLLVAMPSACALVLYVWMFSPFRFLWGCSLSSVSRSEQEAGAQPSLPTRIWKGVLVSCSLDSFVRFTWVHVRKFLLSFSFFFCRPFVSPCVPLG